MSEQFCRLLCGDSAVVMAGLDAESVSACVTDPPYGLSKEPDVAEVMRQWLAGDRYTHGSAGFMQTAWDSFVPGPEYWREVYRVLKPGGYLLAFSSTRTWDLLSMAIRLAGFENRDTISVEGPPALRWYHSQGFPKSLDVSKQLDRLAGAEREVVGPRVYADGTSGHWGISDKYAQDSHTRSLVAGVPKLDTAPATDDAKRWDGWGTALKPAWEVVLMFRKPFKGNVASHVLKHGTGALNIAASRVGTESTRRVSNAGTNGSGWGMGVSAHLNGSDSGRHPANLVLQHSSGCERRGTKRVKGSAPHGPNAGKNRGSIGGFSQGHKRLLVGDYTDPDGTEAVADWICSENCPIRLLDEQAGERPSGGRHGESGSGKITGLFGLGSTRQATYFDEGGPSRFFTCLPGDDPDTGPGFRYESKPSQSERSRGLAGRNPGIAVKSLHLMEWLCKLVTPPSGTILDPFMGTGSTGVAALSCGFNFIGCDQDPEMVEVSRSRMGLLASLDIAEGES